MSTREFHVLGRMSPAVLRCHGFVPCHHLDHHPFFILFSRSCSSVQKRIHSPYVRIRFGHVPPSVNCGLYSCVTMHTSGLMRFSSSSPIVECVQRDPRGVCFGSEVANSFITRWWSKLGRIGPSGWSARQQGWE